MSTHHFRNPDKFEQQPHRDYLRGAQFPDGRDGFVVEDLDLVLRVFGPRFRTDADGKFRLVEMKFGSAHLGASKERTFGMIDRLLRGADPAMIRYRGFYLVNYTHRDWSLAEFWVNGHPLSRADFDAWCLFDPAVEVQPLTFGMRVAS